MSKLEGASISSFIYEPKPNAVLPTKPMQAYNVYNNTNMNVVSPSRKAPPGKPAAPMEYYGGGQAKR